MPLQTSSSTSNDGLGHGGVAVPAPATARQELTEATRQAAAAKLAAARTRLILDKPFLGALVLRLPLTEAGHWCKTTGTDARRLYYNPQWIDSLSSVQTQFALAHEALHCALGHFARRGSRVARIWDLACDFAINPLLLDEGLKPPLGAQVLDVYRDMSAEEIYPCIHDTLDSEQFDDHLWDGEDGGQAAGGSGQSDTQGQGGGDQADANTGQQGSQTQDTEAGEQDEGASTAPDQPGQNAGAEVERAPAPLSAQEKEVLQQQWQRFMAAAAQRAAEAGKFSGTMARLMHEALAPQISWRAVLAHFLVQASRDDYSWQRLSRRSASHGDEALFPSLRSHSGHIVVALDTSGSIGEDDLAQFAGELDAIKGTLTVRLTLLACDAALAPDGPWITEPWETFRLPRVFSGGGGTAFAPVFDWIERSFCQPDALVYFTDAQGDIPASPPNYPVLWLVKGKSPVPWGQRIQLN